MTKQLIVGLVAEGSTDYRLLGNIIRRTYEEIAFECHGDVEILEIQEIRIPNKGFEEYLVKAATQGHTERGIMVLCVHKDADSKSDEDSFRFSINKPRSGSC